MAYTIKHDASIKVVEITFTGLIDRSDLKGSSRECASLQKQAGVMRFLADLGGWSLGATIADVYDLPSRQYWEDDVDPRSRIAILVRDPSPIREVAGFYRNACQNRGWNAELFSDRASALEWLMAHEVSRSA